MMAKKLWGGRFKKGMNPKMEAFSSSIDVDKTLALYDCVGSIAHAKMLGKCGLIKAKEKASLLKGLNSILSSIKKGTFKPDPKSEDIHSAVFTALQEKAPKAAEKLHIARSRNDQVSLDVRMYLKDEIKELVSLINSVQKSILSFSKKNANLAFPGYTHTKHAEIIALAHWAFAYMEMLQRDKERLKEALKRVDVLPLGSCAGFGTTLPIDRKYTAKLLGFAAISENSIDSVSDRDFIIEVLSSLSIMAMHTSRFSEDVILYGSDEFGFFEVDDAFCTGSSIMPQKKNLDSLELIRGRSSTLYGNLVASLTMMKGLPLSYNRDMQLDKEVLFKSVEVSKSILSIMAELIKGITVDKDKVSEQLLDEFLYATDLAELLIKEGVSQSEAHEMIGRLVIFCIKNDKKIRELDSYELKKFSLDESIKKMLNPLKSVDAKNSYGGTSRKNIKRQIIVWERKLKNA